MCTRSSPCDRRNCSPARWACVPASDERDELSYALGWHRRVNGDHGRRGDRERDRLEVLVGIVGNLVEESWVHDVGTESEQQRIAVGRCPRGLARADVAGGAGNVLDIELLPEMLAELLRHQPRECVGHATWREGHDRTYRPRRIGLRQRVARHGWHQGSTGCQMQKSTTRNFHDVPHLAAVTFYCVLAFAALMMGVQRAI